jgi:ribonuclease HI
MNQTKQQSLFSTHEGEEKQYNLFIDGAARGNPGPAGIGIVLKQNNHAAAHHGFFIGHQTNNSAEYLALIVGLMILAEHAHQAGNPASVTIHSDSQLLVQQMRGVYKIKTPHIKLLAYAAQMLLHKVDAQFNHIPRTCNTVADRLANLGIDEKIKIPSVYARYLVDHHIAVKVE